MKLSEVQVAYRDLSGAASTIARQIAFAGIGVVWVFNLPTSHAQIVIPQELRIVLLLLVVCLALDLLQYVFASLIWGIFARILECRFQNRSETDPEMDAPPYLNWPALAFFWGKLAALVTAYVTLATFIVSRLGV